MATLTTDRVLIHFDTMGENVSVQGSDGATRGARAIVDPCRSEMLFLPDAAVSVGDMVESLLRRGRVDKVERWPTHTVVRYRATPPAPRS